MDDIFQPSKVGKSAEPLDPIFASAPAAPVPAPVAAPAPSSNPYATGGAHFPYHYQDAKTGADVYTRVAPVGEQPYQPSPTDVPALENFVAGVGGKLNDYLLGARQRYAEAMDKFAPQQRNLSSLITGVPNTRASAVQQEVDKAREVNAPLNQSISGYVGGVAAAVAPLAPFAAASLPATALLGAAQGGLEPTSGDESAWGNAGRGAAFAAGGKIVAGVLPKIAQPVANALDSAGQKAVDVLKRAGVPLAPGQQTGSSFLNLLKAGLADNPLTAHRVASLTAEQRSAVNRALIAEMGQSGDAATKEVMAAAKRDTGKLYDDVASRIGATFDTQLAGDLQAAAKTAATSEQRAFVEKWTNDIITAAQRNGGSLSGSDWKAITSTLGRQSRDSTVGKLAQDLDGALKGALNRSANSPQDITDLARADRQWQAMKQIEGAVDADGSGNISILRLSNSLVRGRNVGQGVYGNGNQNVVDIAQAARRVLPDVVGNSGTAARLEAAALPSMGANVAATALAGKPLEAAKLAAIALGPKTSAPFALSTGRFGTYLAEGFQNPLARALLQLPAKAPARAALQFGAQPLTNLLYPANGPVQ